MENKIEEIDIKTMIYEIRGKQVMLDSDLAILYGCANGTKTINLAVKRNIDRFPYDFYFQLTEEEYNNLRFQIETSSDDDVNMRFQSETAFNKEISSRFQNGTLKNGHNMRFQSGTAYDDRRNKRFLPYVFTEQGAAMLSSVLRTPKASEVSVRIMRAFVAMRNLIMNNALVLEKLGQHELKFIEYDNKFDILFNEMQKDYVFKQKIFFEGQVYDAHSLIIDIIKQANKEIIIIDNYIDKTVFDLLSNKNKEVNVTLITSNNLTNSLITKFNQQYPKLKIKYSNHFHDRFIIIDNETIYHIGASLKDLGKKCFGINKMEDKILIEKLNTL